jgi:hypothetical protein
MDIPITRVSHLLLSICLLLIVLGNVHLCSAATSSSSDELERLASNRWGDLTDCETRVARAAASGDVAYCGRNHNETDKVPPEKGAAREPYDLGAGFARWLSIDPAATKLVDPKGVQVHGARIREALDLSNATVTFPLTFTNSLFLKPIELGGAQLGGVYLFGSHLSGINAGDVTVRTDVYLYQVTSNGEVDINDGKVGGDLNCLGGKFKNPNGYAIYAEGLKVEGRVYLTGPFSSEGAVEFRGASIGGDLDYWGGKFSNPKGDALSADGLKARNVFLNDVKSEGEVHLLDADLGGVLNCRGGTFNNRGGDALNADRVKAHGDVFLNKPFKAIGRVSLGGAELGDDLDCDGGQFSNATGDALDASDLKARNIYLRNGFKAEGRVSLTATELDGDLACTGGQFSNATGDALDASDLKARNIYLRGGFKAEGRVSLRGAELADDLVCSSGQFSSSTDDALSADDLRARNVFLDDVKSEGKVHFLDAELGGILYCTGGSFNNRGGDALNAERMKVHGDVFLNKPFKAIGRVSLGGAELGGDLICTGGQFTNSAGDALDASDLKARNIYLGDSFKAEGRVLLAATELGGDLVCDGGEFNNSEGDALDAENLKVVGDIDLRSGFTSKGGVDVMGANVGGDFSCEGGEFNSAKQDSPETNARSYALKAENLKVGGNVFLRSGVDYPFQAHGGIDFIGADIKKTMHVEIPGTSYYLDLRFATVSGVLDDRKDHWPQALNLDLDGFEYAGFGPLSPVNPEDRLDWVNRQPKDRFRPQPYEQLAKVLREDGDDSGARHVLIAMESDKRSQVDNPLYRLWSWILWATIGYGYDTWRAVLFSVILVLVGTLLFTYGGRRAWIVSTEDRPESYKPFNGFIYSLETLLPFVDLYQAKHWLPNAQSRAGRNLRRYLWVHTLLGWFFASMIIAGLSGVVQK